MKRLLATLVLAVVILILIACIIGEEARLLEAKQPVIIQGCPVIRPRLMSRKETIDTIVSTYSIKPALAAEIVDYAYKYQRDDFPRAHDILAVISVESQFKVTAKSKLKKDPARGLTQVRTEMWDHAKQCKHVKDNIEQQVRCGAFILAAYYKEVKNKDAALTAYNIGLAAQQRGDVNPNYNRKFLTTYGNFLAFNN